MSKGSVEASRVILYTVVSPSDVGPNPSKDAKSGFWYEFCFRQGIPISYSRSEIQGLTVFQGSISDGVIASESIEIERGRIEAGVVIWEQLKQPHLPLTLLYDEFVERKWTQKDWAEIV